ncbi:putative non-specific serine/threonine protein kinase [Helianthus anomalus]
MSNKSLGVCRILKFVRNICNSKVDFDVLSLVYEQLVFVDCSAKKCDLVPSLSDFGLAKWATPTGLQITSTNVVGTFGKLISNGHPKGEESLVMWAKPVLNSGKFSRLLDPILGVDYDVDQMECMALAAMLCIRRVPRARPQITIVSLLFCSMLS